MAAAAEPRVTKLSSPHSFAISIVFCCPVLITVPSAPVIIVLLQPHCVLFESLGVVS
jgi:hypothetical protein